MEGNTATTYITITRTYQTDHLFIRVSSSDDYTNGSGYWITNNPVDLTGISKIYFDFETSLASTGSDYTFISTSSTKTGTTNANKNIFNTTQVGTRTTDYLDVSSISGQNYIRFGVKVIGMDYAQSKLYRVWME